MTKSVAVLMGGWSAEREVSLVSGRACADALEQMGYRVIRIDVSRDLARADGGAHAETRCGLQRAARRAAARTARCKRYWSCCASPTRIRACVASAVAMDKPLAKAVFAAAGLPLADGVVLDRAELATGDPMPRPFVVKPLNEGSSVGVRIVRCGDSWSGEGDEWRYGARVMVERYVPGREITVAVMGDRALGALEIRPAPGHFYDYTAKYAPGASVHVMPAPIHEEAYRAALDIARRAHQALGCRGVSRSDLRYDDTRGEPGRMVLLEVNTQPGMTPTSLVPEIAQHAGISFAELVRWMVENAACDS